MKLVRSDFTYPLPKDNIAIHPFQKRGESKLLVYQKKTIKHHYFNEIADLIPPCSTLFFNDTKVILARLLCQKKTGAKIEVLLLSPVKTSQPIQETMKSTKQPTTWHCIVKNIKRWKEGESIYQSKNGLTLEAKLINKEKREIEFHWQPHNRSFSQIIGSIGQLPLPPYLKREANRIDEERYQTVYSHHEGGVAAPTAGLHFSDAIMRDLQQKKIITEFLTLHVSGGTFKPIKTENILNHDMHTEQIIITKKGLDTLLLPQRKTIAVGTTSMRVLESLYWFGVKLLEGKDLDFNIPKRPFFQYSSNPLPTKKEALEAVRKACPKNESLVGKTSIFILPGYKFQVCNGLITNFHMPESTLILLVAAFIGDNWKNVYKVAAQNKYKFLSYGDSSLLLP